MAVTNVDKIQITVEATDSASKVLQGVDAQVVTSQKKAADPWRWGFETISTAGEIVTNTLKGINDSVDKVKNDVPKIAAVWKVAFDADPVTRFGTAVKFIGSDALEAVVKNTPIISTLAAAFVGATTPATELGRTLQNIPLVLGTIAKFTPQFKGMADEILAVGRAAGIFGDTLVKAKDKLVEFFQADTFVGKMKAAFTGVIETAHGLGASLMSLGNPAGLLMTAFNPVWALFAKFGELINPINLLKAAWSALSSVVSAVMSVFSTIGGVLSSAWDLFSSGLQVITNLTLTIGGLIDAASAIAAPFIAAGKAVYDSFMTAVDASRDFEMSIAKIAALEGGATDSMDAIRDAAMRIGRDTPLSATQAAEALQNFKQAGLETADAIAALEPAVNSSIASQASLTDVSKYLVEITNAMGLNFKDSEKTLNVLLATTVETTQSFEALGHGFSFVAPTAKALNQDLETVSATLGVLSDAGFTGSRAGTGLNQIFLQLISPTQQLTDMLAKYGLAIEDVNPSTKNFVDILKTLEAAGVQASDVLAPFGVRAGPQLAALLSKGSDALENLRTKITGTNSAAEMQRATLDTLTMAQTAYQGSVEALQIAVGDLGKDGFKELYKAIAPIVNDITEYIQSSDAAKVVTELFTAVLSEVGDIAIKVVASFKPMVGGIDGLFDALKKNLPAIKEWIASWSETITQSPMFKGAVTSIQTTILGLVQTLVTAAPKVKDFFSKLSSYFKQDLNTGGLKIDFTKVFEDALKGAKGIGTKIAKFMWDELKTAASEIKNYITGNFGSQINTAFGIGFGLMATSAGIALATAMSKLSLVLTFINWAGPQLPVIGAAFGPSGAIGSVLQSSILTGLITVAKGLGLAGISLGIGLLIGTAINSMLPEPTKMGIGEWVADVGKAFGLVGPEVEKTLAQATIQNDANIKKVRETLGPKAAAEVQAGLITVKEAIQKYGKEGISDPAKASIDAAGVALAGAAANVFGTNLTGAIAAGVPGATQAATDVGNGITAGLTAGTAGLPAAATAAANAIPAALTAVNPLIQQALDAGGQIIENNGYATKIQTEAGEVKTYMNEVPAAILGAVPSIGAASAQAGAAAAKPLADGVRQYAPEATAAIQALIDEGGSILEKNDYATKVETAAGDIQIFFAEKLPSAISAGRPAIEAGVQDNSMALAKLVDAAGQAGVDLAGSASGIAAGAKTGIVDPLSAATTEAANQLGPSFVSKIGTSAEQIKMRFNQLAVDIKNPAVAAAAADLATEVSLTFQQMPTDVEAAGNKVGAKIREFAKVVDDPSLKASFKKLADEATVILRDNFPAQLSSATTNISAAIQKLAGSIKDPSVKANAEAIVNDITTAFSTDAPQDISAATVVMSAKIKEFAATIDDPILKQAFENLSATAATAFGIKLPGTIEGGTAEAKKALNALNSEIKEQLTVKLKDQLQAANDATRSAIGQLALEFHTPKITQELAKLDNEIAGVFMRNNPKSIEEGAALLKEKIEKYSGSISDPSVRAALDELKGKVELLFKAAIPEAVDVGKSALETGTTAMATSLSGSGVAKSADQMIAEIESGFNRLEPAVAVSTEQTMYRIEQMATDFETSRLAWSGINSSWVDEMTNSWGVQMPAAMDAGIADLNENINTMNSSWDSAYRSFQDVGSSFSSNLAMGIEGGYSDIESALDGIADMTVGGSPPKTGPLSTIDEGGYNVGAAWATGIGGGIEYGSDIIGSSVASLGTLFDSTTDEMDDKAESAINSLINTFSGASKAFGVPAESVKGFLDSLLVSINQAEPSVKAAMEGLVANFSAEGLKNVGGDDFASALMENLKKFPGGAAAVGKSIVQGMATGIKEGAVTDLQSALDFVSDYVIGNSPPKKGPLSTIDKGGKATGQAWGAGLGQGITASMDDIMKTVNANLGNSVPTTMTQVGSQVGSSFTQALANTLRKEGGYDVDAMLNQYVGDLKDTAVSAKDAMMDAGDPLAFARGIQSTMTLDDQTASDIAAKNGSALAKAWNTVVERDSKELGQRWSTDIPALIQDAFMSKTMGDISPFKVGLGDQWLNSPDLMKAATDAGNVVARAYGDGIVNETSDLNQIINQVMDDAFGGASNKDELMVSHGAKVADAFVKGMMEGLGRSGSELNAALNKLVKPMIGQSPPKVGPLMEIDKWGANVGTAWSDSMAQAIGNVNDLATVAAPAMKSINDFRSGGRETGGVGAPPALSGIPSGRTTNYSPTLTLNMPTTINSEVDAKKFQRGVKDAVKSALSSEGRTNGLRAGGRTALMGR